MPPEQDEDRAYEEAQQRALDKLTFGGEHDKLMGGESAAPDPVRSIVFGSLAGIIVVAWAYYAIAPALFR